MPLPMQGGALISMRIKGYTYDALTGEPTVTGLGRELLTFSGYRTFRQVELAQDFGGAVGCEPTAAGCATVVLGLGVRARLPFRVFTLAGSPSSPYGARLVIDVAHRW